MATRMDYEKRASVYWSNYYGQLEGVEIVKFLGMDNDGFGGNAFPKFQVKYPNGELHELVVSQDEEGNGGGFLFLPYEPNMDSYDKAHGLNNYENK